VLLVCDVKPPKGMVLFAQIGIVLRDLEKGPTATNTIGLEPRERNNDHICALAAAVAGGSQSPVFSAWYTKTGFQRICV
jgi:hypothetical protein